MEVHLAVVIFEIIIRTNAHNLVYASTYVLYNGLPESQLIVAGSQLSSNRLC